MVPQWFIAFLAVVALAVSLYVAWRMNQSAQRVGAACAVAGDYDAAIGRVQQMVLATDRRLSEFIAVVRQSFPSQLAPEAGRPGVTACSGDTCSVRPPTKEAPNLMSTMMGFVSSFLQPPKGGAPVPRPAATVQEMPDEPKAREAPPVHQVQEAPQVPVTPGVAGTPGGDEAEAQAPEAPGGDELEAPVTDGYESEGPPPLEEIPEDVPAGVAFDLAADEPTLVHDVLEAPKPRRGRKSKDKKKMRVAPDVVPEELEIQI